MAVSAEMAIKPLLALLQKHSLFGCIIDVPHPTAIGSGEGMLCCR